MTESTQKKRKWDLDDQGLTRSEGTAAKITKVDDEFSSSNNNNEDSDSPTKDQGEAAMNEATAKINAILAQKGLGSKDAESQQKQQSPPPPSQQQYHKPPPPPREKLESDFVKNIPINDLKNRYMLTRGATQAQIQRDTGADVTTRGKYYPDKALATDGEPPLFLHISATSQESLDKAIAQIEDLINNASTPTATPPQQQHQQSQQHQQPLHQHQSYHQERPQRKFHEEKIYVGLESTPHFNLRAKIVGPHGAYVKHIQNETGSRVQLKGKGSGFYESTTGQEAEDELHVHITCTREDGLEKAVELTKDLLNTVKAEYERGPPPTQQYHRGGYHGRGGYRGGYHSGMRNYGYHNNYHHHGGYQGAPHAAPQSQAPLPPSVSQQQPPTSPTSGHLTSGGAEEVSAQSQSQSQTPTTNAYEGDKNASNTSSYGAYDYNQYYAYYGQYQYDPNYYNYYGYNNANSAGGQQPSGGATQPTDASTASYQQQPPPPPPPEESKKPSYNAVPPPPPPPTDEQ